MYEQKQSESVLPAVIVQSKRKYDFLVKEKIYILQSYND